MLIKYLGKSEFGEWELSELKDEIVSWITNYYYECYEWGGVFIYISNDGLWRYINCGHCSCYWPLEKWYSWIFTKEEILKLVEDANDWEIESKDKVIIKDYLLNY